jgi:hypothetical protein
MKVPLSPDREGALLEWNVGGTQGSDPRSTRELSPRGFKHTRQKRDGAGDGARNARSQVAPDLKQSQRNRRAFDDLQDALRDRQTDKASSSTGSLAIFLLCIIFQERIVQVANTGRSHLGNRRSSKLIAGMRKGGQGKRPSPNLAETPCRTSLSGEDAGGRMQGERVALSENCEEV